MYFCFLQICNKSANSYSTDFVSRGIYALIMTISFTSSSYDFLLISFIQLSFSLSKLHPKDVLILLSGLLDLKLHGTNNWKGLFWPSLELLQKLGDMCSHPTRARIGRMPSSKGCEAVNCKLSY